MSNYNIYFTSWSLVDKDSRTGKTERDATRIIYINHRVLKLGLTSQNRTLRGDSKSSSELCSELVCVHQLEELNAHERASFSSILGTDLSAWKHVTKMPYGLIGISNRR